MSFDFNDPSMPIPRGIHRGIPRGTDSYVPNPHAPCNEQYYPPRNTRIRLSSITGSYRVYLHDKKIMLHIAGGLGTLAGKFNSETASGYILADGQCDDTVEAGDWIDFTYFAERSSIRCVEDRRRERAEREEMGLIARAQRGHGSLQFSYNRGFVEAAIIFHDGQGKGSEEWFRGPKLATPYTIAPWFIYRKFLLGLQQRWGRQHSGTGYAVGDEDEDDTLESDDGTVYGQDAMECEVIGARTCGLYQKQPQLSRRPQKGVRHDMSDLREWAEAKGTKAIKILKELKRWEDAKSPNELDRLRHLKDWSERNELTGTIPMMGKYAVTGGGK